MIGAGFISPGLESIVTVMVEPAEHAEVERSIRIVESFEASPAVIVSVVPQLPSVHPVVEISAAAMPLRSNPLVAIDEFVSGIESFVRLAISTDGIVTSISPFEGTWDVVTKLIVRLPDWDATT